MEYFSIYLFTTLGLGFLLGVKHALEADHVVAVSTIISQTKDFKKSLSLGASWGLGHTITLFVVGFIILFFKIKVIDRVALSFEFLVGLILIGLGLEILIKKLILKNKHTHEHIHDNILHIHEHWHKKIFTHHNHRSFLVGLFHGLSGSAALVILALASVRSVIEGLLFILVFGLGSMFGMFLVSGVIAKALLYGSKIYKLDKNLEAMAGVLSIFVGLSIVVGIYPRLF